MEVINLVNGCVNRPEGFSCADCPYHVFAWGYCQQRLLADALEVMQIQAEVIDHE